MSKPIDDFRGAFIFKPADHGILYSTYLNNLTPAPHPETALRANNDGRDFKDFTGTYKSVWIEPNNDKVSAELRIDPHPNGIANVYELCWTAIDPQVTHVYRGLGMLQGTDLVGCYWKATV